MNWQERLLNINNINIEEAIKQAIEDTKGNLKGLSLERMCQVYTSYLFENLRKRHLIVRIINTKELGLEFEHFFIIVNNGGYFYLCDLTYAQFQSNIFPSLLKNGYQIITNMDFNEYLNVIENKEIPYINLEELFYLDNSVKEKR